MAKDLLGNKVNIGDKVVFNSLVCIVKDIKENRILGARIHNDRSGATIKIPDNIVLELDLQYDADKNLNLFVVKTPPETNTAEA